MQILELHAQRKFVSAGSTPTVTPTIDYNTKTCPAPTFFNKIQFCGNVNESLFFLSIPTYTPKMINIRPFIKGDTQLKSNILQSKVAQQISCFQ